MPRFGWCCFVAEPKSNPKMENGHECITVQSGKMVINQQILCTVVIQSFRASLFNLGIESGILTIESWEKKNHPFAYLVNKDVMYCKNNFNLGAKQKKK